MIARTGMLDLGSHPKTWDLLRMTRMPAVRLDCGYLSHPVDRLLLLDARLRSAIAHAVLAAVQRLYLPAEADPPTGTFTLPAKTCSVCGHRGRSRALPTERTAVVGSVGPPVGRPGPVRRSLHS